MLRQIKTFYHVASAEGLPVALLRSRSKIRTTLQKLGLSHEAGRPPSLLWVQSEDGQAVHPTYGQQKYSIPYPPASLMYSIGSPGFESFMVVGDVWAQLIHHYLKPGAKILDIGCGCGRTSRFLTLNQKIEGYIGFDIIRENIEWCQTYITPATQGRFQYRHFDLHSPEYNPQGKLKASEFTFPAEDHSIDLCFAASLFTHILEPESRRYLSEIRRTLKPETGLAVISLHIQPEAGGVVSGTEGRVDFSFEFFAKIAAENGLVIHERVGRVLGQEVVVFKAAGG